MARTSVLVIAAVVVAIAGFLGGAFAGTLLQPPAPKELIPVTFRAAFVIDGRDTGFFVALDKGWYAQEGLNVVVQRGFGTADTIKAVDARKVTIGEASILNLAALRTEGIRTRVVAMFHQETPMGLSYRKDAGINSPKDLEGKTIAVVPGGANEFALPLWLRLNGVDPARVKILGTRERTQVFVKGDAAAVDTFVGGSYAIEVSVGKQAGFEVGLMHWAKSGLGGIYGNGIIAADDMVKNESTIARKFVRATMKGFQYAFDHVDEAVDIILKYNPELSRPLVKQQAEETHGLMRSADTAAKGLGYMSPEKLQKTLDLVKQMFGKVATAEEVATTEFIDQSIRA